MTIRILIFRQSFVVQLLDLNIYNEDVLSSNPFIITIKFIKINK